MALSMRTADLVLSLANASALAMFPQMAVLSSQVSTEQAAISTGLTFVQQQVQAALVAASEAAEAAAAMGVQAAAQLAEQHQAAADQNAEAVRTAQGELRALVGAAARIMRPRRSELLLATVC
jgi:hypothetical protein